MGFQQGRLLLITERTREMERVCFTLKVKEELLDEYLKAHQVWPELLDAISEVGIKNFSLFMNRKESFIIGYFEAENPQESLSKLGKTEINKKWQAHVAKYFEAGSGDMKEGGLDWMDQYFYLA
jgi:L-rhamnose mutarotase